MSASIPPKFAKKCPTCDARPDGQGGFACDCEGKHYPPGEWTSNARAPGRVVYWDAPASWRGMEA